MLLQDNLVEGVVKDKGLEWGVFAQWWEDKMGGWKTSNLGHRVAEGGGAEQGGRSVRRGKGEEA